MSHPEVHGVVVIARNGDRTECYQDPITYEASSTESTPLGEVQAHQLGSYLRDIYFNPDSPSHIRGIRTDLVDLKQVHVRVKVGGEGASVFDSATAVLQGLFPPNPNHKMTLANETTVVAPLNGYQYVPVETVEPSNDRSLESWTDCPTFEKHVAQVQASSEFKKVAKDAQPFFEDLQDYVFGRPLTLENMYNIWDFVSSELIHNITYAHRLPPTFIEQARALANFRENLVFSDSNMNAIGNIAGRTILASIISSLQRVAFNGDPLQFMLIETTYQPFISLFHQSEITDQHPELAAIPDFGSALAIELRRSAGPDAREWLRFKFRNGTTDAFETVHVFGHHEDIPLTEFIYRMEGAVIDSNKQWASACGIGSAWPSLALPSTTAAGRVNGDVFYGTMMTITALMSIWLVMRSVLRLFSQRRHIRLQSDEELFGEMRTNVVEKH